MLPSGRPRSLMGVPAERGGTTQFSGSSSWPRIRPGHQDPLRRRTQTSAPTSASAPVTPAGNSSSPPTLPIPAPLPLSPPHHHHLPLRLRNFFYQAKTTFLSKNAKREADERGKGAEAALSERGRRRVMQLRFSVEAGGLRAMEKWKGEEAEGEVWGLAVWRGERGGSVLLSVCWAISSLGPLLTCKPISVILASCA